MNHIKKMPSNDLKKIILELKENLIQKQNEYTAEIKKLSDKLPIFIQTVCIRDTEKKENKLQNLTTKNKELENKADKCAELNKELATKNKELENQAHRCAELNKELSQVNDELEYENKELEYENKEFDELNKELSQVNDELEYEKNELSNENVELEEDLQLLSEKGFESYIQKQYELRGANNVKKLLDDLWRKKLSDSEQTPVDDKLLEDNNTRTVPAKNKTHEKIKEEKASPITFGKAIVKLPEAQKLPQAQLTNTGATLIF
jgi:chromosome segregation ATPase